MSSRQSTLLAALQRKPTASPLDPPPVATPQEAAVPQTAAAAGSPQGSTPARPRRIGKPVQFWLHDEDRTIVRELSAWLAGQGIRPTDSMVVRAALRMSKPGGTFLAAYRQAALLDGRLRPVAAQTSPERS